MFPRHGVRHIPCCLPRAATLVLCIALATQAAAQTPPNTVFPDEEWEYVRPSALEAYGWSAPGVRRAWEYIRDSSNTTGLMVVDRGRVVLRFGDVEELSYVASVRKSVLAILYGKYVEEGVIDLEKTVAQLEMDDVGGLLDIERRATIHHLITARSGVYHPASNSGDNLADAPARGSQEPGTYMLYSNWDFNAAGAAFEREAGVDIYDALEAQLALPLDFEDWDHTAQRKTGNLEVSRYPAYHMWLSTRDMARIGYLMLREGRWGDRQIVSRDWVRRITNVVTPVEEMNPVQRRGGYLGYGYMWWVLDGPRAIGPFQGAYTARGAWGQWITVLPAVDLVIAHKTNSVYSRTTSGESWRRFIELVLEAKGIQVEEPYPWHADEAGDAAIRGRTLRWTWTAGPTTGTTHEHVFHEDGTVTWRVVDGARASPDRAAAGSQAMEGRYAAERVTDDVHAVSYLAASGYTLTVVLDFGTHTMVGFSSTNGHWSPGKGTFEIVQ